MSRILFSTAMLGMLAISARAAPHPRGDWWNGWNIWGANDWGMSTQSFSFPTAVPSEFLSSVPSTSVSTLATQTLIASTSVPTIATESPISSSVIPTTISSSAAASSSSVTNSDQQAYLDAHNTVRALHGADPLTWSDTLESVAQSWANGCVFEHSDSQYGENLAAGTGDFTIASAVGLWAAEASEYDPSNPQYSHFTQMVWKSTTELGCAFATCNDLEEGWGTGTFYVCNYNPAGNVIGEFSENVQA